MRPMIVVSSANFKTLTVGSLEVIGVEGEEQWGEDTSLGGCGEVAVLGESSPRG